jgi:hypothetical protein
MDLAETSPTLANIIHRAGLTVDHHNQPPQVQSQVQRQSEYITRTAQALATTPTVNHLLTLAEFEKLQDDLQNLQTVASAPNDERNALTLSKRLTPPEVQTNFEALNEGYESQDQQIQQLTQTMKRLLESLSVHLGAVQQREAHLHNHGSRTAAQHVVESSQYTATPNDMMTTFFRAHRDELVPETTGNALPRKLTKKEGARITGMEVNHVSICNLCIPTIRPKGSSCIETNSICGRTADQQREQG